jgi:hypothetical protein
MWQVGAIVFEPNGVGYMFISWHIRIKQAGCVQYLRHSSLCISIIRSIICADIGVVEQWSSPCQYHSGSTSCQCPTASLLRVTIAKLRMVLRVNSLSKSKFCSRNRKRPNEQEKEKWHSTYMGFDVLTESPTDENLG